MHARPRPSSAAQEPRDRLHGRLVRYAESADPPWPSRSWARGRGRAGSLGLEKIGFKRICKDVGAPTPPFIVLSEEDAPKVNLADADAKEACVQAFMKTVEDMGTEQPGLIKSVHGGGGKGTAHLDAPHDPEQVRAAVEKVLEMNRSDGIYFEEVTRKATADSTSSSSRSTASSAPTAAASCGSTACRASTRRKLTRLSADLYRKSRRGQRYCQGRGQRHTRDHGGPGVPEREGRARPSSRAQPATAGRERGLALLQVDSDGHRRYTLPS